MRKNSRAIRRREERREKKDSRKRIGRLVTSIREATTPEEMLRKDPTIIHRGLAHLLREKGAQIPKGTNITGKMRRMWDAFYQIQRNRIFLNRLMGTNGRPAWNEEVETLLRQRARLTQLREACTLNHFIPTGDAIQALQWAHEFAQFRLTQVRRMKNPNARTIKQLQESIKLYQEHIDHLRQLSHMREFPGRNLEDLILVRQKGRRRWMRVGERYEGQIPKGARMVHAQAGWFTTALNNQLEGRLTTLLGKEAAARLKSDELWATDAIYKLV